MYTVKRKSFLIKLVENDLNGNSFSKLVPINRSYFSNIMTGRAKPSEMMALKIAKVLNCNVDEIFEEVEDKEAKQSCNN
ncbi:helix-turn-helix transcriptional regulator [Mammaliicoccus fleurettii]|uniref:helix-turn-helix domain-containing protein n=1 Tax=Mammaliicoccus fleurettii TaxID=150056 RepID=UPI002DB736C0|nr:helix-turn-helix transcriptional regulator [Mammaliicoccus fleurettii]MEB7805401.1 helix-turn-helix transcriptional regulator [Mammaliicoccus fleurettii]